MRDLNPYIQLLLVFCIGLGSNLIVFYLGQKFLGLSMDIFVAAGVGAGILTGLYYSQNKRALFKKSKN